MGGLRHVPNVISGCRLLAMPALLMFALQRRALPFAWLLLAALLSDIADGFIARRWHLQSKTGAALDSVADFLTTIAAAIGVVTLQPAFVSEHLVKLLAMVGLYVAEIVISLIRYGRLSSFHTYLVRTCAYAQGAFLVGLFFWGYTPWLFYVAWTLACAAYTEELILLALLPQWTHDVRGVYWVLQPKSQ